MEKNKNILKEEAKPKYFDMNLIKEYSKNEYQKLVDSYKRAEEIIEEKEKYKR